jgi:hypothetical protein
MIKIIDNFLEEEDFKKIKNKMLSASFPWYYTEGIIGEDHSLDMFQFVHIFWDHERGGKNSDHLIELKPIIDKINPRELYRIKSNMTVRGEKIIENGYHTDYDKSSKFITAVYYINTNDGYTVFEDGTKVNSLENRFVMFDSDISHSGSNCTNANIRCLINFNYSL